MKDYWFLRMGDDTLDDVERYPTKAQAVMAYKNVAKELAQYGQAIGATLHIAPTLDAVAEYPDFVLSLDEDGIALIEQA